MKLVLGTYRADKAMILICLDSLDEYVSGFDEIHFIDDSGNSHFREWLQQFGAVHSPGNINMGYMKAMSLATDLMYEWDDPAVCWWEEDFVATRPIDLEEMAKNLAHKLCQIVCLRQPWFESEKEIGVIAAMEARTGISCIRGTGRAGMDLIYHQATFSCNPGVWGPAAWKYGWPQCNGSEDEKTRYLVEDEQFFALMPEECVRHEGERVGHGY